ncbi:hypothetical protein PsorP6_013269 [Peronosclerospora sorghi]|uniref:Uncharacterized protein n=1 Tax=Peronosclerospora sorghi TaxID=230839 RepID=A0ACC0WES5_9STRA|nr:hypothetical protein PsorP6_013269 [Peronosclerospora sorghi]
MDTGSRGGPKREAWAVDASPRLQEVVFKLQGAETIERQETARARRIVACMQTATKFILYLPLRFESMRIDPGVVLSSLALVAALDDRAATAAQAKLSPTPYKTTSDAVDERRLRTSGRELRVHETMDEDKEEDERGIGDLVKKLRFKKPEPTEFSPEDQQAVDALFPVRESHGWEAQGNLLKAGLQNKDALKPLAEKYPHLLLKTLAGKFNEFTLSARLAGRALHPDEAKYWKTLYTMQIQRLVDQKMTPGNLVRMLGLGHENQLSDGWTCLQDFLKVYNKTKWPWEKVSVLKALRVSKYWRTDNELLYYLETQESNPVARAALDKLRKQLRRNAENIGDVVGE